MCKMEQYERNRDLGEIRVGLCLGLLHGALFTFPSIMHSGFTKQIYIHRKRIEATEYYSKTFDSENGLKQRLTQDIPRD